MTRFLSAENTTYSDAVGSISEILDSEISVWSPALGFQQPILGSSNVLFGSKDYFLQNAFIDFGEIALEELPTENWLGAYVFYAAKMEIDYRNEKISTYKLSDEDDLLSTLEGTLGDFEDLKWPKYLDIQGHEVSALFNCRPISENSQRCSSVSTNLGDPEHPMHNRWTQEAQKANLISSPIFKWIVEQPKSSVTYEELFSKAMEIYKNLFVYLGVITWITMVDSHMGSRTRGVVVSSRLEPIVFASDLPGHNYHFWGFTLKSLFGQSFKYRVMSYVHENWIQGDTTDWLVTAYSC